MLIEVNSEDGQKFSVQCCDGTGNVSLLVYEAWDPFSDNSKTKHFPFTIEETKAIVGILKVATKLASEERDEMERHNGH